jgi:hypothetical protein
LPVIFRYRAAQTVGVPTSHVNTASSAAASLKSLVKY